MAKRMNWDRVKIEDRAPAPDAFADWKRGRLERYADQWLERGAAKKSASKPQRKGNHRGHATQDA